MFEEKESFWKKKGFYLAVCTALVCVLGIGTVYYRMNYKNNNGKNLFADSATSEPVETIGATGGSAIGSNNNTTSKNGTEPNISVAQNNVSNATGQPSDNVSEGSQSNKADEKKTDTTDKTAKKDKTTDKPVIKTSAQDKTKDADKDNTKPSSSKNNTKKTADNNSVAVMSEAGVKNKFDMDKGLLWPVSGDVILKFSMSNTVYFKTLAQYKCNPAVIIASEEGTKVKEAAGGTVTKVTHSDELGNMVTVDIGSGYTLTYGQLKDISVKEGQTIKEGDTIGKVAKPTKYYSEEGSNLYFQVMEEDKSVDPLLLLR
ncbi:MAG: peptidoglycan DD-metalloendopeptidase family protein [Lachnospiraceae bacterium]|nr:peptidoglycan DD-metalloendopeptidase family protein [Lachnospiraceae bacterium]